ncbi:MAG: hypothetical protein FJ109_17185 [Deltaproteobacteria bacterium]|nr:hypothetical protein [Deltaproteobacteria bacterium]
MLRTGCTSLRSLLPFKGLLLLVSLFHVTASVADCYTALASLLDEGASDGVGPSLAGNHGGDALLPEQKTQAPLQENDWRRLECAGRRCNAEKLIVESCSLRQRIRLASFYEATLHSPGRMPGMPGARLLFHRKSGGSEADECAELLS